MCASTSHIVEDWMVKNSQVLVSCVPPYETIMSFPNPFEKGPMEELFDMEMVSDDENDVCIVNEYSNDEKFVVKKCEHLSMKLDRKRLLCDPCNTRLCPECRMQIVGIRFHSHWNRKDEPQRCTRCGMICQNTCTLKAHERIHENMLFVCPDCGAIYKTQRWAMKHLNDDYCHLNRTSFYKCITCNIIFKSKEELTLHFSEHIVRRPSASYYPISRVNAVTFCKLCQKNVYDEFLHCSMHANAAKRFDSGKLCSCSKLLTNRTELKEHENRCAEMTVLSHWHAIKCNTTHGVEEKKAELLLKSPSKSNPKLLSESNFETIKFESSELPEENIEGFSESSSIDHDTYFNVDNESSLENSDSDLLDEINVRSVWDSHWHTIKCNTTQGVGEKNAELVLNSPTKSNPKLLSEPNFETIKCESYELPEENIEGFSESSSIDHDTYFNRYVDNESSLENSDSHLLDEINVESVRGSLESSDEEILAKDPQLITREAPVKYVLKKNIDNVWKVYVSRSIKSPAGGPSTSNDSGSNGDTKQCNEDGCDPAAECSNVSNSFLTEDVVKEPKRAMIKNEDDAPPFKKNKVKKDCNSIPNKAYGLKKRKAKWGRKTKPKPINEEYYFPSGMEIPIMETRSNFCVVCGADFEDVAEFRRHIITHKSGEYFLQCNICGQCLVTIQSYKLHLRAWHEI